MSFSFTFQTFILSRLPSPPPPPLEPITGFLQSRWLVSCLQLLLWPCPAHGWDSHPLQALEATPGPSSFPGDILLLGLYLLHSPPQFPPMSQVQVSISPNESKERTEPPTSDPP